MVVASFTLGGDLSLDSGGGEFVFLAADSLVVSLVVFVAADSLFVVLVRLVGLAVLVVALLFLVLVVVALVVAGLTLATVLRRLRRAAISIFFTVNKYNLQINEFVLLYEKITVYSIVVLNLKWQLHIPFLL